jgi:effector-binding domain-containing protein
MDRELCIIILMGERGQENIQTNLESFVNLQKLSHVIDMKKSTNFSNNTPIKKTDATNTLDKNTFRSSSSIKMKIKVDTKSDLSEINTPKGSYVLSEDEKQFEEVLKKETERRENPLDIIGDYVLHIQDLCKRLSKVSFIFCL